MHLFRSIFFVICASFISATDAEEVLLAPLFLRLASNSATNGEAFLKEIRERTSKHLNNFFSENFASTIGDSYFSHVELIDKSIEDDKTVAKVTFEGSATFTKLPLPQDNFLLNVYMNAFQGEANKNYLVSLQVSGSEFLQDLTYLEISVDDRPVSVQKVTPISEATKEEDNGNVNVFGTSVPLLYLIIGAVLVVVAILAIVGLCCYLRRRRMKGLPDADDRPRGRSKKDNAPDLENVSTRSPSPIRSLASQESSKFTYNPKSRMSEVETLSLSDVNLETRAIDIEAWQKGSLISPITPGFGQDISAIDALDDTPDKSEKKDLSFIDEGSHEEVTPASQEQYLSREKLTRIHRRSPVTTTRSNRYSRSPNQSMVSESGWSDPNGTSFMSEGSDVISDLKNLSVQISKYRSHRR